MNRKKKLNKIFNQRLKQHNAKSSSASSKPKYVSKAERAKLALEQEKLLEQDNESIE
jgi:hypothetical protein